MFMPILYHYEFMTSANCRGIPELRLVTVGYIYEFAPLCLPVVQHFHLDLPRSELRRLDYTYVPVRLKCIIL